MCEICHDLTTNFDRIPPSPRLVQKTLQILCWCINLINLNAYVIMVSNSPSTNSPFLKKNLFSSFSIQFVWSFRSSNEISIWILVLHSKILIFFLFQTLVAMNCLLWSTNFALEKVNDEWFCFPKIANSFLQFDDDHASSWFILQFTCFEQIMKD